MKKVVLFILLIANCKIVSAQKVSVNDGLIKVDNNAYAKIQKAKGLSVDFTISSINSEELIFFKFREFNNPNKVTKSNPKGRVTYYEITFLKSGSKCEMDCNSTKKAVAKVVVENKLIAENKINVESERNFILKNGTRFSEERKVLEGPNVIIIEK